MKSPNKKQEEYIYKYGLNPNDYEVSVEDEMYLHLVHKKNKQNIRIKKG